MNRGTVHTRVHADVLRGALRSIVASHHPRPGPGPLNSGSRTRTCVDCARVHPCPSYRVAADALGDDDPAVRHAEAFNAHSEGS